MAPPAALMAIADQLVLSLVPDGLTGARLRKVRDAFAKTIRTSSYARTNQFEVAEKLDGLEEKFQILNRDDLSDALHKRRVELKPCQDKVLPDVLDLLLRISGGPVDTIKTEHLQKTTPFSGTACTFTWSDIEVTSPIDHNSETWRQAEYSDFSSDEDSSVVTEDGASNRPRDARFRQDEEAEEEGSPLLAGVFECLQAPEGCVENRAPNEPFSELQLVREVLFLLRGLPTSIFRRVKDRYEPRDELAVTQQVTPDVLQSTLLVLCEIAENIEIVRSWLTHPQEHHTMQLMQDLVFQELSMFDKSCSELQRSYMGVSGPVTVSLLQVQELSHEISGVLGHLAHILQSNTAKPLDPAELLDAIYNQICMSQVENSTEGSERLIALFSAGLQAYMRPILHWMNHGNLLQELGDCLIISGDQQSLANLWQEWYRIDSKFVKRRVPHLLRPFVRQILTRGKTMLFLNKLSNSKADDLVLLDMHPILPSLVDHCPKGGAHLLSFSEVSIMCVEASMQLYSDQASIFLHQVLKQQLEESLDDLSKLYFGQDSVTTAILDNKVFRAIDACDEAWNDRFRIADLLELVFPGQTLKTGRMAVYTLHTPTRNMGSRRQSVRILGDLSVEYTLPWPIANIISQAATRSYRRLGLLLSQIRRAKYVLERRARRSVMKPTVRMQRCRQLTLQAVFQKLLFFVNTLYSHMTTSVVEVRLQHLLERLRRTSSVDDKIQDHEIYISNLERAFLVTKNYKTMQDSLLSILDLCIRFSDLAVSLAACSHTDFDPKYFSPAASRKGRRRNSCQDSSRDGTDDDEEEENANEEENPTFVVVESSTISDELRRIGSQFDRHLASLVAGLRSGSRADAENLDWELLAQRIDWKHAS